MNNFFSVERMIDAFPKVLEYLPDTLEIVGLSLVLGVMLGLLLAYIRMFAIPVFDQIAAVYISFIRGTPEIVQLFIVYYGVPLAVEGLTGVNIDSVDALYFAVIAFGINQSAFMAEMFRGALEAVPSGQIEAGLASGLTWWQTFRRIVVPQAVRIVLPGLGVMVVGLFQTTVLASALGAMDVLGKATALGNATGHSLEPYVDAAIIFVVVSLILEMVFHVLSRKLAYGKAVTA